MQKFIIEGGHKLNGEVKVSGSKNAALPIFCATLLTKEKSVLENVPDIADIRSLVKIVEAIGVKAKFQKNRLEIDPSGLKKQALPEPLINKMRASILLLGALLPRFGEVKMSFPGGCVLGKRSVFAHTQAFKELGYKIIDEQTKLHLKAGKIKGKKIVLPELSVTATENAVMAAVLAEGKTEIRLAAAEPHVQDLCNFLKKMGAKISGIGTNNIKIEGVKKLRGVHHKITGDYLEAGTFAIASALTCGDVKIKGIDPDQLDIFWQKLVDMGVNVEIKKDYVRVSRKGSLSAVNIQTAVYPGFPTDLQAPFSILMTKAEGISKIFETLFEGRLNYLFELEKMGAKIQVLNPHEAIIVGPSRLKAVPISSCDIRAGAAMVLAGLIAEGQVEIDNINYIDRGYENLGMKLRKLGAKIERVEVDQ